MLKVLRCEEFADMAPAEVYAVLLDRGIYLCSESTMYRLLRRHGEVRERRRQAAHPPPTRRRPVAGGGARRRRTRTRTGHTRPGRSRGRR